MLAAVEKNFPMPGKRCVIANGSAVTCRSDRPRKLQAITAARLWDEAKGVDVLREARSPVPMLLAGAASGGNEPRAVEFGQAQLVGELSREDLLELFCESSIYVCPSRYEPFGLAPLEAALCGCAVAARDIPSLREVWGEGAVYFEGTVALERLLTELSGDAQALRQAQARSTERAQRFSRGAMASAYLAAFDELRARDKEVRCVA
jgi:glycosyltransferase involved in cell wall biosynthesis